MKTVKLQKLTHEKFSKYGSYADLLHPDGEKIGTEPVEFYRDMLHVRSLLVNFPSISVCRITRRELVIDASERHSYCSEGNLALDGDMIVHVAPATSGDDVPADKIEAFLVPRGTFISLDPGVWHAAAFAYDTDTLDVLIVLPERTYANDCKVEPLPEKIKIEE